MLTQVLVGYPTYREQIRKLVKQHLSLKDEPLLLAVYYQSTQTPHDVFLFEVLDGFGGNSINPEGKFFEVTYSASADFKMKSHQKLHLILTNPVELKYALQQDWKQLRDVGWAVISGDYDLVYATPPYQHLISHVWKTATHG